MNKDLKDTHTQFIERFFLTAVNILNSDTNRKCREIIYSISLCKELIQIYPSLEMHRMQRTASNSTIICK